MKGWRRGGGEGRVGGEERERWRGMPGEEEQCNYQLYLADVVPSLFVA